MDEIWLPVKGYEKSYEVSSLGRIRSLDRFVNLRQGLKRKAPGKLMNPSVNNQGYLTVTLGAESGPKNYKLHKLVATAFLGEPKEGQEVRHLDGNPQNNAIENLAWGTHSENMQDQIAHGNHWWKNKTHCKRGHEFSIENTRIGRDGKRHCRACARASTAKYKESRRVLERLANWKEQ
ncbi:HNH endonuclease [Pseudanabaena phage Pan2]|nr:HNH endonuclease [Pseudanabaena phage Pan2]